MTPSNKRFLAKVLANGTDLSVLLDTIAEDATYVSFNWETPELKAIEPWCGPHYKKGPVAIHKVFTDTNRYWNVEKFEVDTLLGDGDSAAAFDRFRFKSVTLDKISESSFAALAKFDPSSGKIVYLRPMEDTWSSAMSFRKRGSMVFASNPEGGEATIGDQSDESK